MNLNRCPPIFTVSSMESRVVPCMSLTMALSSPSRLLSSVDLPALVSPVIVTGIPSLMTLPLSNESASFVTHASISSANEISVSLDANSTSSSLKSSSSSRSDAISSRRSCKSLMRDENPPRICDIASLCDAAVREAMTSAIPSAWMRSIRPLENARRVNSPASAMRAPCCVRIESTRCWMYGDPCTLSSTTSSPVNECGPRNTVATA